ncbi:MAG TPA: efflux RND transporter periplasmic adaptor subunit [Thermoanaerobaculia bacterium]|nr:efflux RND transporter periplasmic adaptor subunit [Thermoanaerobaculia bacterium]
MSTPEESPRPDVSALRIHRDEEEEPVARRRAVGPAAVALIVGISVLVIVGLLVYEQWIGPRRYPVVETMVVRSTASQGGGGTLLTATGYLVADRKAEISPKVSGRIIQLGFDVGSQVQRGQPLAMIESDQLRAQLRESEALHTEAAREHERQRSLWRAGITSRAVLEGAEAQLKVAQARKEQAEIALRDSVILAPFSGTVVAKNTEVGEIVSPISIGQSGTASVETSSIATLVDLSTLEVEADVNEGNVSHLFDGMPAEISIDAFAGRKWDGRLRRIIPTADRAKGVVKVKVAILDDKRGLLPDMSATVAFLEAGRGREGVVPGTGIWIPAEAIVREAGRSRVQVVNEEERIESRPIDLGRSHEGRVEVLRGLSAGERIVSATPEAVTPGQRVRLQTPKS